MKNKLALLILLCAIITGGYTTLTPAMVGMFVLTVVLFIIWRKKYV